MVVLHGDTAMIQYGSGTWGSRGTTVGGMALMMSVGKLQDKLKKIASTMLEAPCTGERRQPINSALSGRNRGL